MRKKEEKLHNKKNIGHAILLVLIITNTFTSFIKVNSFIDETSPTFFPLTPHTPIIIENDLDFITFSFPGSGVESNPYIIKGYDITTNNETGISISNTTKYFLISDCIIDAKDYGIYMYNVSEGTGLITNNICCNHNDFGIMIENSNAIKVTSNFCSYNWHGIVSSNSTDSLIYNNTCVYNDYSGIFTSYSNFTTIKQNLCQNNFLNGICIQNSYRTAVIFNSCHKNWPLDGIRLIDSYMSLIANNTCSHNLGNNIILSSSNNSIVTNNTCFDDGCGIAIVQSGNVTVNNNVCSAVSDGIWLRDSEHSIVCENQLFGCGYDIIEDNVADYLTYTVNDNSINDKKFGFYCNRKNFRIVKSQYDQLFLVHCSNVKIKKQIVNNTRTGITLRFCDQITISNSICSNNKEVGIHLYKSNTIEIINNTCTANILAGILLETSSDNFLSYNYLINNFLWGVEVDKRSYNNIIHHNTFINNNAYQMDGSSQAKDDGYDNIWYDKEIQEGNYWSDWSDYLGNDNYSIDGLAGSFDLYPLLKPPVYDMNKYFELFALLAIIPLVIIAYTFRRKKMKLD